MGIVWISRSKMRASRHEISTEIEARKKPFGKNLIFSDMLDAETGYLIDTYNQKNIIEMNSNY